MYYIIFHSSNFYDLLSVNIMFDKETKQGDVVSLYLIVSLNLKNYKRPFKQLNTYVQVKGCFFMV